MTREVYCLDTSVLAGWEAAVRIRREDVETSPDEIAAIGAAALWFSCPLTRAFGRPADHGRQRE